MRRPEPRPNRGFELARLDKRCRILARGVELLVPPLDRRDVLLLRQARCERQRNPKRECGKQSCDVEA